MADPLYGPGDRVYARWDHAAWPDTQFTIRFLIEDYAGKGRTRYFGRDARGVTHSAYEGQLTLVERGELEPEPAPISDALRDISWVYGNMAAGHGTKPTRRVFERLAEEQGVDPDEFRRWADQKEWW